VAIKHQYVCDKCGNVQSTLDQFWRVGVVFKSMSSINQSASLMQELPGSREIHVCRPCLAKFGLVPEIKQNPTAEHVNVPPTLEQLILQIVETAMQNGDTNYS